MAWASQEGNNAETDEPLGSTLSESVVDEIPMTSQGSELMEARGDDAIRAHCLRVATWSSELAGAMGLSGLDRNLVEQAALAHQVPQILLHGQSPGRVLVERRLEARGERPFIPEEARAVLETLWGRRPIAD